jgi:hypothetical protein
MHKKLHQFDPQLITKEFFPEHVNAPHLINHGKCFAWAYAAHKMFKGVEVWDVQGKWSHAFIYDPKNKKFYDSERPNGVDDWRTLPAVRYCGCDDLKAGPRKMTQFVRDWKETSKNHKISWYKIDQQVRKLIKQS